MIYLRSEFDLCTGCGICLLVCSKRTFGGYNPRLARLRILSEDENLVNRPLVCTQCENPFCLQVCPVHAISKDPETGVVLIDKETCTGCGACVSACPDHMIRLDNECKADK
ncbi:MAG: 4Fe-4S dicluster domain-containing protein, partial [Bacillota bacterium]